MAWILLATTGQFINAVVAIIDKYIVSDQKVSIRPFVYAFYSCLLTGAWVAVYLLGFLPMSDVLHIPTYKNVQAPTLIVVSLSLLAAYTFFMALVSMYDALRQADASDVMPVIGAVSVLASFGMSYYFLDSRLSQNFIIGIIVLSFGTFLVSHTRFNYKVTLITLHSGIFFAFHYITMKGLFQETSFDDGFFWSRIAFVGFTLSLLMVPAYLDKVRNQTTNTTKNTGFLILLAKILAGVAAFMLLKATDWGDVTVVQALDGLKYVFIIIIAVLFAKFLPKSATDKQSDRKVIARKLLYVVIITIGFVVLFL
ncbi:hypothetical protein KC845_02800 [Candidatus Kaiserbacteria bacterium]|nr:hypothetical protein [Candidatus Kaiserbacteria bacterium]